MNRREIEPSPPRGTITRLPVRAVERSSFGGATVAERAARWLVLVVRMPAESGRHRVAVLGELRRTGAVPLGQGCWAVPEVPAISEGVARSAELARRGSGEMIVMRASGRAETDTARLTALFTEARQAEWAEFLADCGKFTGSIDADIAQARFTLTGLEDVEQSLERLRRWHRDLATRDVFGTPGAAEAAQQVKVCTEKVASFADTVFRALQQM
jgi:hypothetical protein